MWDDGKRVRNIEVHAYDFVDLIDVFEHAPAVTRRDGRREYGKERFNSLMLYRGRVVNVTFTPRGGKLHLISVRPASRVEGRVYRDKIASR